jgi:hypothetical protein
MWNPEQHHPPFGTHLKLMLQAEPYRCARCRYNFASFMPLAKTAATQNRASQVAPARFGMQGQR